MNDINNLLNKHHLKVGKFYTLKNDCYYYIMVCEPYTTINYINNKYDKGSFDLLSVLLLKSEKEIIEACLKYIRIQNMKQACE